jgi:hypothetical protein
MLSPKVEKFHSEISGHGLKTNAPVKRGEVLINFEGNLISVAEANRIYATGDDYMLQVSATEFLRLSDDSKYINHSCNPDAAFLHKNGELVALKDIPANQEITFDYSANEDTEFLLNCKCGHHNCRKQIVPFHKNSPEVQARLAPILSPYLRQKD